MSHTTTADNIDLRPQAARPLQALQLLFVGATRSLRALTGVGPRTIEQIVARDAASVRAMADSFRFTDPSFASDLYAAANRHESAVDDAAFWRR